jgi:hypothetical protein
MFCRRYRQRFHRFYHSILSGASDNSYRSIILCFILAIYGVDSVLTIVFRLINRENIFEAHRSHAYQYLSNELGMGHLLVSAIYAGLQFLINILIIYMVGNGFGWAFEILTSLSVLGLLSLFYLWIRALKLKKQSLQAS